MASLWLVSILGVGEVGQKRTQTCTQWIWLRTLQDPKVPVWSTLLLNFFTLQLTKQAVRPKSPQAFSRYTLRSTSGNWLNKRTSRLRKTKKKTEATKKTATLRKKVRLITQKLKTKMTATTSPRKKSADANPNHSTKRRLRLKRSSKIRLRSKSRQL